MPGSEQREFRAEVRKVLNILTNSLYTNREIFLRISLSSPPPSCHSSLVNRQQQLYVKQTLNVCPLARMKSNEKCMAAFIGY